MKKTNNWIKLLVVITFLAMVTVNALANILPINGQNTGAVSDSYKNLFAPTGITFTIWGLIYLLLLIYTIYQIFSCKKDKNEKKEELLKQVGMYFSISSIANMLWIFAWHYNMIILSALLMLIILLCLMIIYKTINKEKLSNKEKFFVKLPFSIYFGWITVATIANITALIVGLGIPGIGTYQVITTAVIIGVGFLIGSATILKNKDFAYGLVIIWAYLGIYIKHTAANGFAGQYSIIIYTVIACIALLVVEEIYALIPKKDKSLK